MRSESADLRSVEREIEKELSKKPKRKRVRAKRGRTRRRKKTEYEKKLDRYRKRVGRKRLSAMEKEALKKYTAAQVDKGINVSQKTWSRRINKYRKTTGKEPDQETLWRLRFETAEKVLKESESGGIITPPGEPEGEKWAKYTQGKMSFDWYDLPPWVRKWSRNSNDFLYQNQALLWYGGRIRFPEDMDKFVNGRDWTAESFVRTVMQEKARGTEYVWDPENTYSKTMLILRSEWENTQETHSDVNNNLLYKPKDWNKVDKDKIVYV